MDRAPGSNPVEPRAPAHLRWDIDGMESHACTLVEAHATASEILLNFGARRQRKAAEVGPALVIAIALSPVTARNLAATLRRLIDEHDGGTR